MMPIARSNASRTRGAGWNGQRVASPPLLITPPCGLLLGSDGQRGGVECGLLTGDTPDEAEGAGF
jgi:hypothetical protein